MSRLLCHLSYLARAIKNYKPEKAFRQRTPGQMQGISLILLLRSSEWSHPLDPLLTV